MNRKDPVSILTDPTASYWLRDAVERSIVRDPVDALHDAQILTEVLQARFERLKGSGLYPPKAA